MCVLVGVGTRFKGLAFSFGPLIFPLGGTVARGFEGVVFCRPPFRLG